MTNTSTIQDIFLQGMSELADNNFGKSVELLSQVIDSDGGHKLALVARGSAHLKLGKTQAAQADFNRAIEMDPEYARAYHLRGLACETDGDNDGALIDFAKAIDLDPEYGAAYYSRSTLLAKLGRNDEAADDIQMITHLTNRNIESFANENNVWRSQHLQMEAALETDLDR